MTARSEWQVLVTRIFNLSFLLSLMVKRLKVTLDTEYFRSKNGKLSYWGKHFLWELKILVQRTIYFLKFKSVIAVHVHSSTVTAAGQQSILLLLTFPRRGQEMELRHGVSVTVVKVFGPVRKRARESGGGW